MNGTQFSLRLWDISSEAIRWTLCQMRALPDGGSCGDELRSGTYRLEEK
jgi:hypothetical protein